MSIGILERSGVSRERIVPIGYEAIGRENLRGHLVGFTGIFGGWVG
jgi:hypothetical protein